MLACIWLLNEPEGLIAAEPREGQVIDVSTLRKYVARGTNAQGPEFKSYSPKKEICPLRRVKCIFIGEQQQLESRLWATTKMRSPLKTFVWELKVINQVFVTSYLD